MLSSFSGRENIKQNISAYIIMLNCHLRISDRICCEYDYISWYKEFTFKNYYDRNKLTSKENKNKKRERGLGRKTGREYSRDMFVLKTVSINYGHLKNSNNSGHANNKNGKSLIIHWIPFYYRQKI